MLYRCMEERLDKYRTIAYYGADFIFSVFVGGLVIILLSPLFVVGKAVNYVTKRHY